VSADMEAGYGEAPEAVAETVRATIAAGAIGLNIEDSGPGHAALIALERAALRIAAGRKAADEAGVPVVINARIDAFFPAIAKGLDAMAETVKRATAYRAAGADCIFIPFVTDGPTIGRLAEAIAPPINVLAQPQTPALKELAAMGVRRVTVGGNIARAAYTAVRRAIEEFRGPGTFTFAANTLTHQDLNSLMS
ncbi:MAG: isocitrate lyase/phosphoenolpyruvate mutase family protein, partial [Alphaproteobacteria bacterium]|nr:isocitrate lyase/phosphoenolpyruvate mutase family protein [Alphaproteobacteria bacterium]